MTLVQEPYGSHWLHADGRHFVSHYEAVEGVRAEYWQAYTSKAQPPKGRMPWTVDNRRIGRDGYGYPTLEEAMRACGEGA
jgi:hypothetical protein